MVRFVNHDKERIAWKYSFRSIFRYDILPLFRTLFIEESAYRVTLLWLIQWIHTERLPSNKHQ
jgi:hypothetical protein